MDHLTRWLCAIQHRSLNDRTKVVGEPAVTEGKGQASEHLMLVRVLVSRDLAIVHGGTILC